MSSASVNSRAGHINSGESLWRFWRVPLAMPPDAGSRPPRSPLLLSLILPECSPDVPYVGLQIQSLPLPHGSLRMLVSRYVCTDGPGKFRVPHGFSYEDFLRASVIPRN